jgi:hypothetical protein
MNMGQTSSSSARSSAVSVPTSIIILSTLFQRIGIWLAGFPFPSVLVLSPILLGIGFLTRRLTLCPRRLLLFIFFAGSVVISSVWGEYTTPTAMLLFLLVYGIWVLACPVTEEEYYRYFHRVALLVSVICVLGVVQYFAQFIVKSDLIFSWRGLVPGSFLIEHNVLNELSYGSGHYKSNGVFLMEPSSLSGLAGRELLLVVLLLKDVRYIFPLALGMAFALSGQGVVFALLFASIPLVVLLTSKIRPANDGSMARPIVLALVAAIVISGVFSIYGDYFLGRLGEYSHPTSSSYARYVTPFLVFEEHVIKSPGAFFLGYGPGSFDALVANREVSHETGWIKLFVELGLLGVVSFCAFFLYCVFSCTRSWYIAVAMLFHYLLIDSPLLSPQFTFLAYAMFVLPVCSYNQTGKSPATKRRLK